MTDAREYGRALYMLAEEENRCDEIRTDAEAVREILRDNPEYIKLLDTPALTKEERLLAIDESLASIDANLRNLIKILSEHHSVYMLPSALDGYFASYDEAHGIERVEAISAVPMLDEELERLKSKFEKETGKTIIIKNTTDPSLLGGMKLRGMGIQLDSSLKTKLETLERSIRSAVV